MKGEIISPMKNKAFTSMNLEKRELFEFSTVFAFPKISRIELDFKMLVLILSLTSVVLQRYSIKCFDVSVLPAPDNPDTTIV